MTRKDHAEAFHALHEKGKFLILANAWDAASARLIQETGVPAIATSSAALAWANGWPDGDALPVSVHADAVRRIARVIRIPLTVDCEGGYSDDPAQVADNVGRLIDAGAAGINLEDGTGTAELHAAKIGAVRKEAARRGVNLFINARIDTVLRKLTPAGESLAEIRRRAGLYAEAGADGIFIPGLTDAGRIGQVVRAVDPLPLNVLVWPGLPPTEELRRLGVRRLSSGAWIARDALAHAWRSAADFLTTGNFSDLLSRASGNMPSLNDLFPREQGAWEKGRPS